jgi:hypothetical protein
MHTDIHTSNGIRAHDPSVREKTVHTLDRAATVISTWILRILEFGMFVDASPDKSSFVKVSTIVIQLKALIVVKE